MSGILPQFSRVGSGLGRYTTHTQALDHGINSRDTIPDRIP